MGIAAMIASIKNNKRKPRSNPLSKGKIDYKMGESIQSKELTPDERKKLLFRLKRNRSKEDKLRLYKLIITFTLTVIVIPIIIMLIKLVFF